MAEPTNDELVKIANGFLMSAPPGEFMEVVTDVRALLPKESMLNDSARQTFKSYNEDQMIQVAAADGHKFIICKQAEVGDGRYLDTSAGQVVTFDHIKQEVTGTKGIAGELDAELEPLRSALDKAAQQYVAEQFPFGTCGVYSSRQEGCIYVCISASKFNPTNFWNGRWRSVWTVPAKTSGNFNMNGRIRAQVHYYEDGNVQLVVDSTKKIPVAGAGDANTAATNVIKAIIKTEQALQASIDTSYASMGDNTFKALRRPLPISHQKINWNLIRGYRLGSEVSGSNP